MPHTKSIAALPGPIKDIILSDQFADKVEHIAEKNNLRPAYYAGLVRTTVRLLRGELAPGAFVITLSEELDFPRDEAMRITQDLNREIFNDVKDSLKELNNMGVKKLDTSVVPAQPHLPALHTQEGTRSAASEAPKPAATAAKLPLQPPLTKAPPPLPSVPPQTAPPTQRDPSLPVRSDWGWHGKKNEATGQIEFKHEEGVVPGMLKKSAALPERSSQSGPQETTKAVDAHVGSIFEQKLGGAFTIKGEATKYGNTGPTPPSPDQTLVGQRGTPPAPAPREQLLPSSPTITQRQSVVLPAQTSGQRERPPVLHPVVSPSHTTQVAEQGSLRGAAGFHVPHKPTQSPTIPPAQVLQQPRNE